VGFQVTGTDPIARTQLMDVDSADTNTMPPPQKKTDPRTYQVELSCGTPPCSGNLEIYATNANNCWTETTLYVDAVTVSAASGDSIVSIASAIGVEGADSAITFPVSLNQAAASDLYVFYRTEDISATGGVDYVSTAGGIAYIPMGSTSTTIRVPIMDNNDTPQRNLPGTADRCLRPGYYQRGRCHRHHLRVQCASQCQHGHVVDQRGIPQWICRDF